MNAQEFSEVAGLLTSMGGVHPQGRGRSAISRYYYAAFLEARDRLAKDRNFNFKKNEAHQNVQRCFSWSDEKPLIVVGRLLEDLKKLRERADYDLANDVDPTTTGEAKRMCEDIQKSLATADLKGCKDLKS